MVRILVCGDFQGVFPSKLKSKLEKEDFDLIVGVGDYGGINEWRPYILDLFRRLKRGDERISPEEFFGKKKLKYLLKKDFEMTKKVLKTLDSLNKPTYIVFGNTDDDWYSTPYFKEKRKEKNALFLKKLKNVNIINYGKKEFGGFDIIGFGGYMDIDAFFKKKTFKSEREDIMKRYKRHLKMRTKFFSLLKKTDKKLPKIFVFHYPPKGIFDIIKDKNNPMDRESAGVRFYSEAIKKYKPVSVFCGHMHEYRGMKKLYGVPIINPGDGEKGKAAIVEVDDRIGKIKSMRFIG
ncbi:MAG: metallophosphoesterase [Nanoarchaeota archaeon]|nr:metallophosphoesterase [Nanoarchaeota archaeon]